MSSPKATSSSVIQSTAKRIADIPEFRPRSTSTSTSAEVTELEEVTELRRPFDDLDIPIIACNSNGSWPARQYARRPFIGSHAAGSAPSTARRGRDNVKKRSTRVRSASAGRDRKSETASRYWAFLFDNLERSISEIYDTCEKQESVLQCKEVLLVLENYRRDFLNLIEWLNLKWTYEQTPQPMRPNALAWEIRKPSSSALPHTRAYEKLVGLSSSVPEEEAPPPPVDPKPSTPPLTSTVDFAHQTDLEEDPYIYYFAGGRHVGSQTEEEPEYGPLELFAVGSGPVTLVLAAVAVDPILDPVPSDPEGGPEGTATSDMSASNIETMSSSTQLSVGVSVLSESSSSETMVDTDGQGSPPPKEQGQKSPVEGKDHESLVLEGQGSTVPKYQESLVPKGQGSEVPKGQGSEVPKDKGSAAPEGQRSAVSEGQGPTVPIAAPPASIKSTFADKAKTGMLRAGKGPLVRPSTCPRGSTATAHAPTSAPTLPRPKTAPKPTTNYRSNIASRYRAAANTGQPPLLGANQVGSQSPKHSATTMASAPLSPTAPLRSPTLARKSLNTTVNTTPKKLTTTAAPAQRTKGLKVFKAPAGSTHAQPPSMPTGKGAVVGVGAAAAVLALRPGVCRSKSMINPANFKSKGKDNSAQPIPHTHSFISLPDETVRSRSGSSAAAVTATATGKRASRVDEDGWETVRTRSNRSKWSSSSSSLHSSTATLSRTSLDKSNSLEQPSPPQPSPVGSGKLMVASDEDELKIQKNEAALDSAMREEELLEQELLQVEKDFEEIENQSTPSTDVSPRAEEGDGTRGQRDEPLKGDLYLESPSAEAESGEAKADVNGNLGEADDLFAMDQEPRGAGDFLPREPGRIVTLRDKLMSPSRKSSSAETLRKHHAKLAKAERNREKLLQAKFNRYVELSDRFESLNEATKRLVEERAVLIHRSEERRKKAGEKRELYLKGIKMKAHDEEAKAKEIAFINYLEAQNKRHDLMTSAQGAEGRLQLREEERKSKLEERGVKLNGVLERQSRLRTNWEGKLKELKEKRERNEERIAREKEERAKERADLAQEKARDREERLAVIQAAKQAEKEELQKKIQQRQEDTARRHDENIEQIRQKAIELSIPRSSEENTPPTSVRICTLCQVTMPSEVQELAHLRGRAHLDAMKKTDTNSNSSATSSNLGAENFGLKFITDVQVDKLKPGVTNDRNRTKILQKHARKLLHKLEASGAEFEGTIAEKILEEKGKELSKVGKQVQKNIKEISRLTGLFSADKGTPQIANMIDRLLLESRKLVVRNKYIQERMIEFGAFSCVSKVLSCKATDLPAKVQMNACILVVGCIFQNMPNTIYALRSTCMPSILEFASIRWNALVPDDNRWLCGSPSGVNEPLPIDPAVEAVMELLFNIISIVPDPFTGIRTFLQEEDMRSVKSRTLEILGYLVSSGVIDRFSVYVSGVRGPVDSTPLLSNLLQISIDLITSAVYALEFCWDRSRQDPTQLLATLESSEFAATVSMSYSLLLYQGAPIRPRNSADNPDNSSTPVPPHPGVVTGAIVKATLSLINAVGRIDIGTLQSLLGSESMSLQIRHILSQLLWQVVPHRNENLLWARLITEMFSLIANFTVLNKGNQAIIQSGQTPTVLQQLCNLPSEFLKEIKLMAKFLPTLIACSYGCPENQAVLVQENISLHLLEGFLKSEYGKHNGIMRIIIQSATYQSAQVTTNGGTSACANGKENGNPGVSGKSNSKGKKAKKSSK